MTNQRRLVRKPMLYITQPDFKPAEAPMQTSFQTRRPEKNTSESSATSISENEKRMRRQNQALKDTVETVEKVEEESEPENENRQEEKTEPRPGTRRERRQRFQDLSLEGKVNYFFHLSPHVPKMKCEVTTEEEKYRGYINEYKDGIVHMKVFQRPFHQEVPFEDITDIRLIGF